MGLWPMCFILVVVIISSKLEKESVFATSKSKDEMNIGTVLFDKGTSNKRCWTNDDLIILNSRKMFQDLLPKMEPLNIQNDKYIADLLNYFNVCLEYVSNMSTGKTKHLMLKSLADAMGGYLHSYVVPITKVSYYAGTIEYRNAEKVLQLLAELKQFLSSDGTGWRKPVELEMFINVTPIAVNHEDASAACNRLVLNPASKSLSMYLTFDFEAEIIHGANCDIDETVASRQSADAYRGRFKTKSKVETNIEYAEGDVDEVEDSETHQSMETTHMYLPYFDSNIRPNSIAVPFKNHNLWSLYEEESIAILSIYYETNVNCISSNKKMLANFNKDFYKWLLESVYPRLNDDKWYPAFGGVLRIIAFLRDAVEGVPKKNDGSKKDDNKTAGASVLDSLSTVNLVVIAILSAALVWVLVGLSLVCYRHFRKHPEECSPCDSPRSDFALLYQNDDFCEFDTGRSTNSRKSIGSKVKEWWRQRFKTCPGGCDKTLEKERCIASVNYYSKDSLRTNASRRSYKRRKKKIRSVSVSASPSSSPCEHYTNKRYHYSSDMSSSSSESSFR